MSETTEGTANSKVPFGPRYFLTKRLNAVLKVPVVRQRQLRLAFEVLLQAGRTEDAYLQEDGRRPISI